MKMGKGNSRCYIINGLACQTKGLKIGAAWSDLCSSMLIYNYVEDEPEETATRGIELS